MYVIEKNAPAPIGTSRTKYPFGQMKVGDSFAFEPAVFHTLSSCAYSYGQRHGMKFSIRVNRCWRVA